ncbi:hypothetical protein CGZ90_12780 [Fictibacillus aquaticus]|uniref:Uncharacterized protein n=1 Tax=Fictibacillus aquaticus TaxID=2021314 RepID=A0A235F8L8_9BACL|nr:hypothetical protein CGZ90_12780 [Fictibacillus aquaticus]
MDTLFMNLDTLFADLGLLFANMKICLHALIFFAPRLVCLHKVRFICGRVKKRWSTVPPTVKIPAVQAFSLMSTVPRTTTHKTGCINLSNKVLFLIKNIMFFKKKNRDIMTTLHDKKC